jgi:hypothetical protein
MCEVPLEVVQIAGDCVVVRVHELAFQIQRMPPGKGLITVIRGTSLTRNRHTPRTTIVP